MAKSERVVLVDGSWLVFRAFFALPQNLKTNTGLHTNAVLGFANMFRKLFSGRKPERGAVVFDAPGRTHREEKFPAYKAQRPPVPGELVEQLPWIDRVVSANRFPLLRKPGFEADDVVGTLARRAEAAGMDVVIVAGDKDFAQLIGERIRMFDTMRDVTYDAELVRKKWGVGPEHIVDLLALMGDTVPMGMAISDPQAYYQFINDLVEPAPDTPYGNELKYVRLVAQQAQVYYQSIKDAADIGNNLSNLYPAAGENYLADQLRVVAQLISGGLQTPIYIVTLDGFDTHHPLPAPPDCHWRRMGRESTN